MNRTTIILFVAATIVVGMYWDKETNGSIGVGDSVGNLLHFFGITKKPNCGCQKRHDWLNENMPYA